MEYSTAQAAQTGTTQDTKPAMQPHATSTLDATKTQKRNIAIQRPHQATLGTQTEDEKELCKPETTGIIFETTPSPAPEMAGQTTNQRLVTPMCCCGRVAPPQETPAMSDPSLDQQSATELAKKFLSPEDYARVNTTSMGETLGLKEKTLEDVTPTTPMETNSLGLTQPKDIRVSEKVGERLV